MPNDVIIMLAVGGYVLAGLIWLSRRGVFQESIFIDAPPRSGRLTIMDLAFGLLLMVGGQMVAGGVVLIVMGPEKSPGKMLLVNLAALLGAIPAIALVCVRIMQTMDGGLRGFGLRCDQFGKRLLRSIGVIVFVLPTVFWVLTAVGTLWNWLGGHTPSIGHDMLRDIRDSGSPGLKLGLIAVAVIGAPIVEEFFFRGLVQTTLRTSGLVKRRWTAIIIAATLFALIHVQLIPLAALPGMFVLGLGLGYAYERTGAIWSSMLLHMAFNMANIAAVLWHLVPDKI